MMQSKRIKGASAFSNTQCRTSQTYFRITFWFLIFEFLWIRLKRQDPHVNENLIIKFLNGIRYEADYHNMLMMNITFCRFC